MADNDGLAAILQSLMSGGVGFPGNFNNHDNSEKPENAEKNEPESNNNNNNDFLGGIDFDMLMKFSEIFAKFNEIDKNTALLAALRPHMREENRKKIDGAMKFMKLISLLPILKENGLTGSLF